MTTPPTDSALPPSGDELSDEQPPGDNMDLDAGLPGGQDVDDPRFDQPAAAAAPAEGASSQRLDLLDVPLNVTVELGRTKMPISDVLNLASGAVIELEKMAGEPLDLLLNGRLVARGEAVVVGERFGIRITTIVSPRERRA